MRLDHFLGRNPARFFRFWTAARVSLCLPPHPLDPSSYVLRTRHDDLGTKHLASSRELGTGHDICTANQADELLRGYGEALYFR